MTDPAFGEIDVEYATAMAARANRYMAQLAVPPMPDNFAVWFNYSTGASPGLKEAIDALIAGNKRFDAATNHELFSTFVAAGQAGTVLGDVQEQLKSVMNEARGFITEAVADNRTQIQAIGGVVEQVDQNIDPRSLVERLVEELTKAAARASKLEVNLSETSQELDVIREALIREEQKANTDTLTGLPNRRALDEFLSASQVAALECGSPLSVLLLDIDHFKQFNDNCGHGVGDQVLRLMADVLRDRLREKDLPARYGGEELIGVLPGADLAVCGEVAERIRSAVSECRIKRRSSGDLLPAVTVSIGVAQFRPGESVAQLIERCDKALYMAKRIGRNRVVTERRLEGNLKAGSPI